MKYGVPAFAAILVAVAGQIGPSMAMDRKISTRAVDWSNRAQVVAVYEKLARAAEGMCASTNAPHEEIMECAQQTLTAAIEESGKQELMAFHEAKGSPYYRRVSEWK